MILTPTTFVVGAGASVPYGLPTGSTLLDRAKSSRCDRGTAVYDLLLRAYGVEHVPLVFAELERFTGRSIDEFILTRRTEEHTQSICKGLIAALLGDAVRRELQLNSIDGDDWVAEVAEQMLSGAESFDQFISRTQVSFVTFNFDSVVETKLAALVRGRFPEGDFDEKRLFSAVPVIHVHGRLPAPPDHLARPVVSYELSDPQWTAWLPGAAQTVTVISDSVGDVAAARRAVTCAQTLCFLGFSFHSTNAERLGLPVEKGTGVRIFATRNGEPDGVLDRFTGRIGAWANPRFGESKEGCSAVLRRFPVFVD